MFKENLNKFIEKLKSGNEVDEWYLSDFISDNVIVLSGEDAYEELVYLLNLIESNLYTNEMYEYLQIAIALRNQSATNQIPTLLLNDRNFFQKILDVYDEDYITVSVKELNNLFQMTL
ncbi:hypothetical protein [Acinetobacter sp. YH12145]|uniref:hypothetical protein n=1 Tax=Acinetobacter TaxID=469 RepID=UPI0015D3A93A|nr:hypothetical protein [Acinetobacter sp. YH12145]